MVVALPLLLLVAINVIPKPSNNASFIVKVESHCSFSFPKLIATCSTAVRMIR